jgi:hypothetical protein
MRQRVAAGRHRQPRHCESGSKRPRRSGAGLAVVALCGVASALTMVAGPLSAAGEFDTRAAAIAAVGAVDAADVDLLDGRPMIFPGEELESPGTAPALLPDDVLRSAAESFPKILEAVEKAAASRGSLLAAQGAFDVEWRTKSLNWLSGFYDGQTVDSKVVKPIADGGIDLAAGYRISDGILPIYQDEYLTNDLGEINFGIIVSLLRDRQIDDRRFKLRDATFNVDLADFDLLMARLQVQHAALRTYWDWLAAGQKYLVYSELLDLARNRDSAFQTRVAEGDLAEIFLVGELAETCCAASRSSCSRNGTFAWPASGWACTFAMRTAIPRRRRRPGFHAVFRWSTPR